MIYINYFDGDTITIMAVEGIKKIYMPKKQRFGGPYHYAIYMETTDEDERKIIYTSEDYDRVQYVFKEINNILEEFFNQSENKHCYFNVISISNRYYFENLGRMKNNDNR